MHGVAWLHHNALSLHAPLCSQLFSATELERLVCGNPFLDFESLQKHARYEGGYSPGEQCWWLVGWGWASRAADQAQRLHIG